MPDNKGMTLVEITVGFLMLAIIITTFIKMIDLSSEMTSNAITTKESNLLFEKAYYNGYNYFIDNNSTITAFRSGSTVDLGDSLGNIFVIELKELTKNNKSGEFFEQLYLSDKNDIINGVIKGEFVTSPTINFPQKLQLSNIRIKVIENVKDKSIARKKIYRYFYS